MFFDGQNAYITASYLITLTVFSALIIWVLIDRNKQKKTLNILEEKND